MRVKSINFLGPIDDIEDVYNCTMDVSVTLENGLSYVVVVGTPKSVLTLMANEKSDFLSPGNPIIFLKRVTREAVEEAINAYAEENEAYRLKHYSAKLDTKTLDVLINRYFARDKFLDDLLDKGESIDIENYDLIDFIQKDS